jgi:hypothetical protein
MGAFGPCGTSWRLHANVRGSTISVNVPKTTRESPGTFDLRGRIQLRWLRRRRVKSPSESRLHRIFRYQCSRCLDARRSRSCVASCRSSFARRALTYLAFGSTASRAIRSLSAASLSNSSIRSFRSATSLLRAFRRHQAGRDQKPFMEVTEHRSEHFLQLSVTDPGRRRA